MKSLTIATRNSPLALWQAEHVRDKLVQAYPGLTVTLLRMTTRGDKLLDSPLSKIGGKGLFVKELESAMLAGKADIAVHSVKDMPAVQPEGLHMSVILERENPTDAFVSNNYLRPEDLPAGAIVGTCSLRRQAQLKARFPQLKIANLRGNVNTRLAKLDAGEYDAIILASAGLIRLNMHNRIASELSVEDSLPAAGQGVVGVECRLDDNYTNDLLSKLHHPQTNICVTAERALNARLDGGCQVPIGAYAVLQESQLWLRGLVAKPDGTQVIELDDVAPHAHAKALGVTLAERLLCGGADAILRDLGLTPQTVEPAKAGSMTR